MREKEVLQQDPGERYEGLKKILGDELLKEYSEMLTAGVTPETPIAAVLALPYDQYSLVEPFLQEHGAPCFQCQALLLAARAKRKQETFGDVPRAEWLISGEYAGLSPEVAQGHKRIAQAIGKGLAQGVETIRTGGLLTQGGFAFQEFSSGGYASDALILPGNTIQSLIGEKAYPSTVQRVLTLGGVLASQGLHASQVNGDIGEVFNSLLNPPPDGITLAGFGTKSTKYNGLVVMVFIRNSSGQIVYQKMKVEPTANNSTHPYRLTPEDSKEADVEFKGFCAKFLEKSPYYAVLAGQSH